MRRIDLVALFTIEILKGLPSKLHAMPNTDIEFAVKSAGFFADAVLADNEEYEKRLADEAEDRHIRSSKIPAEFE